VGIPWLHQTCGVCEYCRSARENLCERAVFTGWMVDGGYAEYAVAPEDFVYALPEGFSDLHVRRCCAPELSAFAPCGFPACGRADASPCTGSAPPRTSPSRWRATGTPASTPFPATRAIGSWRSDLGAVWAGGSDDEPPEKVDATMIFAPDGELVKDA
jgi:propanol-preferring alcohol dehydrogenase